MDNRCPYYTSSWAEMDAQGNTGIGYRLMYNPDLNRCIPTPAAGMKVLRESVILPRG